MQLLYGFVKGYKNHATGRLYCIWARTKIEILNMIAKQKCCRYTRYTLLFSRFGQFSSLVRAKLTVCYSAVVYTKVYPVCIITRRAWACCACKHFCTSLLICRDSPTEPKSYLSLILTPNENISNQFQY